MEHDKYRMKLLNIDSIPEEDDMHTCLTTLRAKNREWKKYTDERQRTRRTVAFLCALWRCYESRNYYKLYDKLHQFEAKKFGGR